MSDGKVWISASNIDACAAQCGNMSACVAVSYDRWSGKCYFKSRIVTSLLDPRSIIAVRKPMDVPSVASAPVAIQVVRNRSLIGVSFSQKRASDLEACKKTCFDELRCVAFSFMKNKKQGDNCESFNVSEGLLENSSVDSGYKYQSP
jgi:hypothetical protein